MLGVRIIGVIDVLGGRAVHARAGARDRYSPVQHVAGSPVGLGNVQTLASLYMNALGVPEIYVADLDAILKQQPQEDVIRTLASLEAPLWVDAGVRSVHDAQRVIDLGATRVVVGLETLPSFDVLSEICAAIGSDRVAFSLDLREGQPIVCNGARVDDAQPPEEIANLAVKSGASAVIVIDLARVGTGRGIDSDLLGRIHSIAPGGTLVAGGGVRHWDDLVQVAKAGCSAVLVATALHNGRITAAQISEAKEL
jgi:phosphoribosylformimino-5-aminoimidazole carboxamide ribotide isomerase